MSDEKIDENEKKHDKYNVIQVKLMMLIVGSTVMILTTLIK